VPSLPRACVTLLGFVDLIFGHLQVSCPLIPFREKVVTYFYSGLVVPGSEIDALMTDPLAVTDPFLREAGCAYEISDWYQGNHPNLTVSQSTGWQTLSTYPTHSQMLRDFHNEKSLLRQHHEQQTNFNFHGLSPESAAEIAALVEQYSR
ncbi:MAG: hypothetical protein ACK5O9_02460, partial [Holosporales bacterium]